MVYNQIWPINPMNNFYFLMEDDILTANKNSSKEIIVKLQANRRPNILV